MEVQDSNWSFSAPQYVDFTAPTPTDDDADKWFDVNDDGEAIINDVDNQEFEDASSKLKENCDPVPQTNIKDEEKTTKKLANILSLEEWNRKKSGSEKTSKTNMSGGAAQRVLKSAPTRQSPRLNGNSQTLKKGSSLSNLHMRRNSAEGSRKTIKTTESQSKLKRSSSLRNKQKPSDNQSSQPAMRRGMSTERLTDSQPFQKPVIQKKLKATMPMTPKFMKRKHASVGSPRVKNSEEQELEKIAEFQRQMVERRKQAEESLKKLKEGGSSVPIIKSRSESSKSESDNSAQNRVKGFFSNIKDKLRSTATIKSNDTAHPKPEADKFESMAERVLHFQKGTPERFHTIAKDRCKGLKRLRSSSKSPHKTKLTMPATPNLQCARRNRPVRVPTRQELEEKEVEEMKKNQFHARPVNHKILEQTTGVKKVSKKPVTETEGFNLNVDKRIKERESTKPKEEEKFVFQAQPVNPKIMEGVVGVKPAKERPGTVPQSPAFTLKNRVRLPVEIPEEKRDKVNRARHVPHHGIPFQPKITHKTTVIQPFSFETRDKERKAEKEAKIQQVLDEEQKEAIRVLRSRPIPHVGVPFNPKLTHKHTIPEPFSFEEQSRQMELRREAKRRKVFEEEKKAREFHAQPMPQLDEPVGIPEKHARELTQPIPFEFEVDFRSTRRADETNSRNEEDMLCDDKHHFKARPPTVIYQEPFVPKKSTKPLTDASDFELSTEKRAAKRESFEMYKKHKEAELEALKRQKEFEEQEAEKERVAKERQERVHKANPIRNFAPVKIHHSDKPLTKAESPQFSDRFKI